MSSATLSRREADAAYHADHAAVSHSMMEVFRQSAALYYGRFIARTIPAPEPTESMLFGSLVHCMALTEDAGDHFAVAPECDRRTKDGKAAWAEFQARSEGRDIVTAEQWATADRIAHALHDHPVAGALLSADGDVETPVYWSDRTRRCKPDKLVMSAGGQLVACVDLKAASDPSPDEFRRAVAKFGYHRQAAWYTAGLAETYPPHFAFIFIVVGNRPPHDVAIYKLDGEALQRGSEDNALAMQQISECQRSGEWASDWAQDIKVLSLPRWALSEASYS